MKPKTKKKVTEVTLKEGQEITEELMEDLFGRRDLDTGDLGEPEEIVEEKIIFRRG